MTATIDHDIAQALGEVLETFQSHALDQQNSNHPVFKGSLTRAVILVSDCLKRAKVMHELECDLPATPAHGFADVSLIDAIGQFRNVIAHAFSEGRAFTGGYMSWVVDAGGTVARGGAMIMMQNRIIGSAFVDDILVVFGDRRLYVYRDLGAAYNWLVDRFAPHLHKAGIGIAG